MHVDRSSCRDGDPVASRKHDARGRHVGPGKGNVARGISQDARPGVLRAEDVTLQQIYAWTLQLSEFEDDPSLANDDILYAIYQDWFEEYIHGK